MKLLADLDGDNMCSFMSKKYLLKFSNSPRKNRVAQNKSVKVWAVKNLGILFCLLWQRWVFCSLWNRRGCICQCVQLFKKNCSYSKHRNFPQLTSGFFCTHTCVRVWSIVWSQLISATQRALYFPQRRDFDKKECYRFNYCHHRLIKTKIYEQGDKSSHEYRHKGKVHYINV